MRKEIFVNLAAMPLFTQF